MTWYSKTQWVLLNVNNATSVIITLAYWTLIASSKCPSLLDSHRFNLEVFFFVDTHATSINKHGLNSVYAIINIFLTAKPINITHMWHPVLFSLIYVVFSVIYQLGFGVPPIYTVLDWSKPTTALLTSVPLVFIGVPLCHVMFFILYRTRCVIFRKCCLEKDKAETSTRHSDLQDEQA
nr:protein rolling stone-like [Crassostrea gigas]